MKRVIGTSLGLAVLIGVLVTAFVWPSSEVAPRDVPLAVAGPPEAVAQVEGQLAAAMPDAFDVQAVADGDEARQAIEDRTVYGAVVLDPAGPPQVLTASAGSPAVAQLLEGLAARLAAEEAAADPAVAVEDVVPLPEDDPRGIGFNSGALPMVMAGLAVGYVMALTVTGVRRRLVGASIAAVFGGMAAVLVMHSWIGVLDGNWWAEAGTFALMIAAVSYTIIGLQALMGHAGLGLAALLMLLLGNPLSGVTSAPELLPTGWGDLGQALPPGAGGALLRSTAYFDGAGAGGPVLVLTCWVVGGLLLAVLGSMVTGRGRAEPADVVPEEAAPASR